MRAVIVIMSLIIVLVIVSGHERAITTPDVSTLTLPGETSSVPTYQKPSSAEQLLKGKKLPYGAWINENTWAIDLHAPYPALEFNFTHETRKQNYEFLKPF